MRTNKDGFSEAERAAAQKYFRQHPEWDTDQVGTRLCKYFLDEWKTVDLTDQTIGPAIEALKAANEITPKELQSGEKEFNDHLLSMEPSEVQLIFAFKKDGFDITFESINRVVRWIRNNAGVVRGSGRITTQSLDAAKQAIDMAPKKRPSPHTPDPNAKTGGFIEDSRVLRARERAEKDATEAAAAQAKQPKPEKTEWEKITRDAVKNARNISTWGRREQVDQLMAQAEATGMWAKYGNELLTLFRSWQRVGN
jgi:hypothetical protein